VQAVLVIEVLFASADGAMFVFQILSEDVFRDSSDRPARIHIYPGGTRMVHTGGCSRNNHDEKHDELEWRQETSEFAAVIFPRCALHMIDSSR